MCVFFVLSPFRCRSHFAAVDIDSSNTSPSYSPSLPDMASTPNFEVDNILNINNNNKITAKQYQSPHPMRSPSVNGGKNENILPELSDKQGIETAAAVAAASSPTTTSSSSSSTTTTPTKATSAAAAAAAAAATLTASLKDASQHRVTSETRVAAFSPIHNNIKTSARTSSSSLSSVEPSSALMPSKRKGDCSSRLGGKYAKINGTSSQLPSNATNSNSVEGSYHCQFCSKTFPRLGYLKKHEQVSNELFQHSHTHTHVQWHMQILPFCRQRNPRFESQFFPTRNFKINKNET